MSHGVIVTDKASGQLKVEKLRWRLAGMSLADPNVLTPRMHDTFREGGRGWGDTVINEFPFLRIDQVWVSGAFQAVNVVARKTRRSDHRMVVCDLTTLRDGNKVPPR